MMSADRLADGQGGWNTYLVKFAPTYKPSHLVTRLELFKTNDTLGVIAVLLDAVFFSRDIGKHATGGVTMPM